MNLHLLKCRVRVLTKMYRVSAGDRMLVRDRVPGEMSDDRNREHEKEKEKEQEQEQVQEQEQE